MHPFDTRDYATRSVEALKTGAEAAFVLHYFGSNFKHINRKIDDRLPLYQIMRE